MLLTTHYMDEAQQLCDRVAIVDRGKLIALGSPAELIRSLGAEHFVVVDLVDAAAAPDDDCFLALPDVVAVDRRGERVECTVSSAHTALPAILDVLEQRRIEIDGLATRHATLEDVFVHLTGRHLREGGES